MNAQIKGTVWYRSIPVKWSQRSGSYRTDIPASILANTDLRTALYLLPDGREVAIGFEDLRKALRSAPHRSNGCVGPFDLDVSSRAINGTPIPSFRILHPSRSTEQ